MPSLLNFKPILDTYKPDAGAEDIRQGTREAAHYISKGIEAAGERGREREKEFSSVFDVDISKTTDLESKNYLVGEYDKLKRDYISKFEKNKNFMGYGKLSTRDKIELRSDLDSLKSSAETLKILDKSLVEAADPKNERWGYEVDSKKQELYSEAKNTGDLLKMAEVFQSVGDNATGNPFVKYSNVDVPKYISGQVMDIRGAMDKSTELHKKQTIEGGKIYNESVKLTKYGTPEEAKMATYNVMAKGEAGPVLEYNLTEGDVLTPDEKKIALEENAGTSQFPMLRYYTDNKMDVSAILKEGVSVSTAERPYKEPSSTSSRAKNIKETELGWDYGTFPIRYDGDIEIDGKMTSVSGVANTGITKKDGKYFAKFKVPRDIKAEKVSIEEKMDKESVKLKEERKSRLKPWEFGKKADIDTQVNKEMEEKYGKLIDDKSKKKTVLVPLEDVYDELAPKLKYNKMYLKGFNPSDISKPKTGKVEKKKAY